MNIGEHEAFPVGVAFPQGRQIPPAVADLAAQRIQAPQQGGGIGQAVADPALRRPDRAVVQRQRRVVLPELEMEQRLVPPDMRLIGMTGARPQRLPRRHPSQPVLGPPGHFHDMRDRVMRPEAGRLETRRLRAIRPRRGRNRRPPPARRREMPAWSHNLAGPWTRTARPAPTGPAPSGSVPGTRPPAPRPDAPGGRSG